MKHSKCPMPTRRRFALVVTLSLMILLTVIAIGLLTLSSMALRTTSEADAGIYLKQLEPVGPGHREVA